MRPQPTRTLVLAASLAALLPSCFRKSSDGGGTVGPPVVAPQSPVPVSPAVYLDLDGNGMLNPGDEVWVTFDRFVTFDGLTIDSLTLPVQGDRFGGAAAATALAGSQGVRVVLGANAVLKSRQVHDGSDLLRNAPSALNVVEDGTILDFATGGQAVAAPQDLDLFPAHVPSPPLATGLGGPATFVLQPDLDRDGRSDLVLVSPSTQEVAWRLGIGNGLYVDGGVASLGFAPDCCAMADLDRDRRPDLVIGSASPARISAFRFVGNGPGDVGFSPWTTHIEVGSEAVHAIELVDLDRDGYRDVVFGHANGAAWLRNLLGVSLDGSFPLSGLETHALGSGDLDGNGVPDLVLGHDGPNSVLLGTCQGPFLELPALGDLDTRALLVGDADGDGLADVIESGTGDDAWYQGTGTGVFFEQGLEVAGGPARALALEDLDGDSVPELLRLVDTAEGRWVHLSLPAPGGFEPSWMRIPAEGARGPLDFADLDQDGDRDLVLGGIDVVQWRSSLSATWGDLLLLEQDPGGFGSGSSLAVLLRDLDGDGDLDHLQAHESLLHVRRNLGDGTFADLVTLDTGANRIEDVATADLDQDGDLDLLLAGTGQGLQVYLQEDLVFTEAPAGLVPDVGPARALAVGDLDDDGDLDVVVGALRNTTDKVLKNLGLSTQPPASSGDSVPPCTWIGLALFQELSPKMTHDVVLHDVDLDGDLDAVFAHGVNESDAVWLNFQGQGFLVEVQQSLAFTSTSALEVGDFTGDGLPDLVLAGTIQNQIWPGAGDGTFTFGTLVGGEFCEAVLVTDLNGDGAPDLLTGRNAGIAGFELRLGPVEAWTGPADQHFDGAAVADLAVGDVDGDGDLEVFTANPQPMGPNVRLGSR